MIIAPTLRLARINDGVAIAVMSRDHVEGGLPWTWQPDRVRGAIRDRSTNVVVAHEGPVITGFAIMQYGEDKAHLSLLCVSPPQRGQGVGRHLLEWLEKSARVAGIERIELEVRADNQDALTFYELRGYTRCAIVLGYYQGRIDALKLAKKL